MDIRLRVSPVVRTQSGLAAGLLQKLFAGPFELLGHLRKENSAISSTRNQQTMNAGLQFFRSGDLARLRQYRNFDGDILEIPRLERRKTRILCCSPCCAFRHDSSQRIQIRDASDAAVQTPALMQSHKRASSRGKVAGE